MSALPQKRTLRNVIAMSALCQKQTFRPNADLVFTPSAVNACEGPPNAWINSHLCLATNTTAISAVSWCSEPHAGLIGVAG
jgi:hypothetical protein